VLERPYTVGRAGLQVEQGESDTTNARTGVRAGRSEPRMVKRSGEALRRAFGPPSSSEHKWLRGSSSQCNRMSSSELASLLRLDAMSVIVFAREKVEPTTRIVPRIILAC
jgi:hypothetical protein